ncbi:hypothetical protein [Rhodopirellula halodulae]|uniref:hypothetical protein n=1 Tax=Rhodopirellula halodulae TaxID=2894198 RepID=UPI001E4CC04C|nr:hypothetical protein [Rhodopirellula sp. JC737]MCC9657725.1 hypothetical protein [Rhodopirellula sp. JC737]
MFRVDRSFSVDRSAEWPAWSTSLGLAAPPFRSLPPVPQRQWLFAPNDRRLLHLKIEAAL